MLRITRMDGTRNATILRLEGRLTQSDLAEFDAAISACRTDKRHVVVDLAGVGFLDESCAAALAAAQHDDVELIGASPFVKELLEEVAS